MGHVNTSTNTISTSTISTNTIYPSTNTTSLSISVWQTGPTHCVLDWLITLAEKATLTTCTVAHAATDDNNEEKQTVEKVFPLHRTFLLTNLVSTTSYWVKVTCMDRWGVRHYSNNLTFTTGDNY